MLCRHAPTLAQVRGGSISGTVEDQQGGVLPGASVTAQGVDATIAVTTIADGTFHFLDLAPGPYKITAGLTGFSTVVRDNIIVVVGRNVQLSFSLNVAGQVETIDVTGAAPIIDETVTGTAANFTRSELTNIPTSRDPFALMRGVPGVLLDQVNVGGNETGQQAIVLGKGTRQQDTSWTIDGVEITDMGAPGQSPTYFNFDNFEEIQVSTAGGDISQRTGGIGINLITKRGTNQFRGGFRGYLSNDAMEASNVPDELKALATPVTPETADHTLQTSDWGFDFGGPLVRDKAWFYASMSRQDIRIFKRSTKAEDRTKLNNPQVKVNWQATKKDLINFLYFNGFKIKDGRTNPANATTIEEFEATHHQDNAYADNPLHGLFKIGDDRVIELEHVPVGDIRLLQHRHQAHARRGHGRAGGQEQCRRVEGLRVDAGNAPDSAAAFPDSGGQQFRPSRLARRTTSSTAAVSGRSSQTRGSSGRATASWGSCRRQCAGP